MIAPKATGRLSQAGRQRSRGTAMTGRGGEGIGAGMRAACGQDAPAPRDPIARYPRTALCSPDGCPSESGCPRRQGPQPGPTAPGPGSQGLMTSCRGMPGAGFGQPAHHAIAGSGGGPGDRRGLMARMRSDRVGRGWWRWRCRGRCRGWRSGRCTGRYTGRCMERWVGEKRRLGLDSHETRTPTEDPASNVLTHVPMIPRSTASHHRPNGLGPFGQVTYHP